MCQYIISSRLLISDNMSTEKTYDICIVGSGITGSLVAEHFLSKGLNVIMLERGNDVYLPDAPKEYWRESWQKHSDNPAIYRNYWNNAEKYFDDLVKVENVHEHFGFFYNMKYGLGGSGAVWSGASWRFTPDDFKTQTQFGYSRDWPFTYEELAPYYAKVEQIFFTSGPQNEPEWLWQNNYKYPAFKQSYLDKVVKNVFAPEFMITPNAFSVKNLPPIEGGCVGAKTCVKKCPSNARFRPDLHILHKYFNNDNFTILMNTPCLKLTRDKNNSIKSVSIIRNGKVEEVKAKYYFLAANTIENLRILHNSADEKVANSSGLLGHFFASHGAVVMSVTLNERLFVGRGRPTTSSAINTLNHKDRDQFNSYMMEIWNFDWNIGITPSAMLRNLRKKEGHWGLSLFNKVKEADHRFMATLIFEMEMQQRNTVMLSKVKDKFGLPLAKVDFKLGERDNLTFETMKKTADILKKKNGVKNIKIPGFGLNGNHPLGGYVCGENSKTSVVDPFMRSHDHNNLYILGGGAFNSTSALNPTHTIAALTLKALNDKRISF
jgi:choline dehydrogenase-like flavoprotein